MARLADQKTTVIEIIVCCTQRPHACHGEPHWEAPVSHQSDGTREGIVRGRLSCFPLEKVYAAWYVS